MYIYIYIYIYILNSGTNNNYAAEVCELVGALVLSILANSIPKGNAGLYSDDGLILMRDENGQKTDRIRKEVIKIFKKIGFKIEIKTKLKVIYF